MPQLKSIILCGGEVFVLPDFPKLVNELLSQNIFITIITNGTVDRLEEISDPTNCQLIVSFDGPRDVHDTNRGTGNYDKSVSFVRHALDLGFPVDIFYLVTQDSYKHIDSFDLFNLNITYLVDRLGSLSQDQVLNLLRHYPTYPSKKFGCYQLALQSDGYIYGCCESNIKLGSIDDPIDQTISMFTQSLSQCSNCSSNKSNSCGGCCQPNYFCDFKKFLNQSSCQSVIKTL